MMETRRITSDPDICHGKPCIAGTRVMVSVVLDNIADGEGIDAVAEAYHVTREDVLAAVQYAADLARDRVIALPAESA